MSKFPLGQVVTTATIAQAMRNGTLDSAEVAVSMTRHACGDWGDISEADRQENELSLREGFRLMSVYHIGVQTIWIITEADRSVTTVLFPEDY